MMTAQVPLSSAASRLKRLLGAALSRASTHVVLGCAILLFHLLASPLLLFPILFVIPVGLAAWHHSALLATVLAVLLPVGRFFIAATWELQTPMAYMVANALIHVAVLVLLAYLVSRTARLTRQLQQRVEHLVKMCAWSRTVEYEGEWISFEEYLLRRFDIRTTHGMSPAEAQKQIDELMRSAPDA